MLEIILIYTSGLVIATLTVLFCISIISTWVRLRIDQEIQALKIRNVDLSQSLKDLEPRLRKEISYLHEQEQKKIFDKKFHEKIEEVRKRFNREFSVKVNKKQIQKLIDDTSSWMAKEADFLFRKMSRQLLGDMNDRASSFTRSVRQDFVDKMWNCFQQYKSEHQENILLLPKNSRICYTKGNRTLIVIEQSPTTRTVSFTQRAVDGDSQSSSTKLGFTRYNLSFPYLYFFITYDYSKCVSFSIYLKNSSITSTEDVVHPVPLPNIWQDRGPMHYPVCMGTNFWEKMQGMTIVDQANRLIEHFWLRTFNMHLGNGGYKEVDERISSLGNWEKETKDNPLFILTIDWKDDKKISDLIATMLDWREQKNKLDFAEKAMLGYIESTANEAVSVFEENVRNVKETVSVPTSGLEDAAKQKLEMVINNQFCNLFDEITFTK